MQIDDDEFVRLVVGINQFFRDAEAVTTQTCLLVRSIAPRVASTPQNALACVTGALLYACIGSPYDKARGVAWSVW